MPTSENQWYDIGFVLTLVSCSAVSPSLQGCCQSWEDHQPHTHIQGLPTLSYQMLKGKLKCNLYASSCCVYTILLVHASETTITHPMLIIQHRHIYTHVCGQGPLLFWRCWTEPVQSPRSQRRRLFRKEYFSLFSPFSLSLSLCHIALSWSQ